MSKCIYCGTESIGNKCVFNPYSDTHIHESQFLNRNNIQSEKAMVLNYFFNKFKKPIISENYKSPLDRLYKRVSSVLYSIAEPLIPALVLQETSVLNNLTKQDLITSYEYKQQFIKQFKKFNEIVAEAYNNLPPEVVEEALAEAIIQSDEH
jgi:hypothetical protein